MAEILTQPTALSKVIPLSVKLNEVDTSLNVPLITNKQFNTADTDAWFSFTLDGLAATTGTFDLTLINLQDKSVFNHTDKVFNTNPFYYKLDSGTDELTNEIRHAGKWVGQLVVTLPNGDSATRKFIFAIEGHILDGTVVQTILLEDYNALIADIEASKNELAQYNIDYASLIGTVTDQEAARVQAEELRVIADALRETKEGTRQTTFEANEVIRDGVVAAAIETEMIAQNVATKLTEKEATFAPRMLSLEEQLEQKANTSYVETLMSNITDGSPKELFYSISALSTKYPSGANGPILVMDSSHADGAHSYIWNGTQWQDVGIYQSTGLADKSITEKKTTFFELGENLLDVNTFTKGYYVYLNGNNVPSSVFSASDFFELEPDIPYHHLNLLPYFNAFYNASKELVQYFDESNLLPNPFQVDATVKYARFSREIARGIPMISKTPTGVFPVPYQHKIKDEYIPIISTVADKSITEKKTTFFELGENLLDVNTFTKGYYVYLNGNNVPSSVFSASDFFELEPDIPYHHLNLLPYFNAFYNASKELVQYFDESNLLPNPFQVDATVKYARFSREIARGIPMISKTPISTVEPYQYKLKDEYASNTTIEDLDVGKTMKITGWKQQGGHLIMTYEESV